MSDNVLLYSELRKILSDVSKRPCDELDQNDDLFEAGVLDSFGIIEFVVTLEKHFNCTIPQEDLIPQNLWSIHAIAETLFKLGIKKSS